MSQTSRPRRAHLFQKLNSATVILLQILELSPEHFDALMTIARAILKTLEQHPN